MAPSEAFGSPNRVWYALSQVLVKVLNGNQASVLKFEDGLPRFVHFFLFLEIVFIFPSLYVVFFPCWNWYSRRFLSPESTLKTLKFDFLVKYFFVRL